MLRPRAAQPELPDTHAGLENPGREQYPQQPGQSPGREVVADEEEQQYNLHPLDELWHAVDGQFDRVPQRHERRAEKDEQRQQ